MATRPGPGHVLAIGLLLAAVPACVHPAPGDRLHAADAAAVPGPDPRVRAAQRLERVAVLGASVADGFGLALELSGEQRSLADFLAAAERDGVQRTRLDLADHLLFLQAEPAASAQIEAAAGFQPTLVLAPDLLFWFVYGDRREDQRAAALERGLALIDGLRARLDAPIVLGDVPDMSAASELMLPRRLRPGAATLANANRRLIGWAAERDDVVLVPLADLAAALAEGGPLAGPGWSIDPDQSGELLQADGLHPTVLGTALLLKLCFEALAEREARLQGSAAQGGSAVPQRQAWSAAYSALLELDPERLAQRVVSGAAAARLQAPR